MNKLVIFVVLVVFVFLLTYDPKSRKLEKYISAPAPDVTPQVVPDPESTCSEDRYYKLQFAKNPRTTKCTGKPVEYMGAIMQA